MSNVLAIRRHTLEILCMHKIFRQARRMTTFTNVCQRMLACPELMKNVSPAYAAYTNVLPEFLIRRHTLALYVVV